MPKKTSERLERRHIDTIVMVARHGSIHAAARALGFPQPLLTNLLQDAERILGRSLFSRSHKGCVLLPDARTILNSALYASKALETLDDTHGKPELRLRLGCIPRVTHMFVPALLRALDDISSGFRVEVVEGTAGELQTLLVEGELDCFMGRRPVDLERAKEKFRIENLYQEKTVLIAGTNHPLTRKTRVGLKDLAGYPWILPKTRSYSRGILNELFSREGLTPPPSMIESVSFLSNLHLVSKSDCISIAPDRAAGEFEKLGLIKIIKTTLNLGEYTIVMMYHDTIADRPGFTDFQAAAQCAAAEIKPRAAFAG